MSQLQQPQEPCVQCGAIENQFISLDCQHSFCLVCMSYVLIKSKAQQNGENIVICPVCDNPSHLDKELMEAIQQTIENIIIPNLNNMPILQLSTQNNDSLEEYHKSRTVSMKKSSGQTNIPSINIPQEKLSFKVSKRFSQDPSYDNQSPTANKYFFSKCASPMNYSRDSLIHRECCSIHPLQQITSVCLSCDNEMVCTKCLLASKHKGHNVKILYKGIQFLTEQANFKKLQMNHKLENLQLNEKRLKNKSQFIKERLFKSQQNISESFQQLIYQIKKRQSQLQQECFEVYHSYEQKINQQLVFINQQILNLKFARQSIQTLLSIEKPFEFLKAYSQMVSNQSQIQQYVPKTKIEFQSHNYLQISEDDLANVYQQINRINFQGRKAEEEMLTMSTKRLGAFVSCHNSKQKKKVLRKEESIKNLMKKKPININVFKIDNKSISEYTNMLQKPLTSKSVYHTERSVDGSKNTTFSKFSITKGCSSNRNLLQVQKKIRPFQKQKTQKKNQSKDTITTTQKVLQAKRKKRV